LCQAKDTVTVSVNPSPTVTVSADTAICAGGAAFLTASSTGQVTFNWLPATGLTNPASGNTSAAPTATTKYFITVTGTDFCAATDSVLLTVNPAPVFAINPPQATVCAGDSVLVTASGGDVYEWLPSAGVSNPASPATEITPALTATYHVFIINNTCKVADTVETTLNVVAAPVVTIAKSNDVDCINGQATLTVTGGNEYTWSPAATLSNPYSASPVASPLQTTTYYVAIKSLAGCVATDSVQVKVLTDVQNGYYLANAFTPNGDNVNDCFGVRLWGGIKSIDFSVYNRWGQRIFHTNSPSGCWDGNFNGQPQPPGTYVYMINANTICGLVSRKGTVVLVR
jgi:gliding motility-associated-like protein